MFPTLDSLCRTCLIETTELLSLDTVINLADSSQSIKSILEKFTNIDTEKSDDHPLKICNECTEKLTNAVNFQNQCLESANIIKTTIELQDKEETAQVDVEFICIKQEENDWFIEETYDETSTVCIEGGSDSERIRKDENKTSIKVKKCRARKNRSIEDPNEGLCTICGVYLNTFEKYSIHMKKHNSSFQIQVPDGPFECTECEKTFRKKQTFQKHMKLHQSGNPTCDICGKVYPTLSLLKIHQFSHSSEKPYKCNICGKSTISKYDMNTHMRFHTGERPFKCHLCEKTFYTRGHLTYHLDTHSTAGTEFECDVCKKKFKSRAVLHGHMKMHKKSVRFTCEYCDKSFTCSKHVLAHLKKHAEYQAHRCEICGKTFRERERLEAHLRFHEN